MAHTPGPWRSQGTQPTRIIIPDKMGFNGQPYRIADAYFSSVGLANTPRIEEAQANAHLIASAPDLLAALTAVVEFEASPDFSRWANVVDNARSAIKKARGE